MTCFFFGGGGISFVSVLLTAHGERLSISRMRDSVLVDMIVDIILAIVNTRASICLSICLCG